MPLWALSREFPVGWVTGPTAPSAALCIALHPGPSSLEHMEEEWVQADGICVLGGQHVCGNVWPGAATLKAWWFQQEVERVWPA